MPSGWIVPDNNRNCRKLASAAFQGYEMSVALGDALDDAGRQPNSVLDGHPPDVYLVSFPAEVGRQVEQAICRDPKDDEPAHGLVVGKKTGGCQRALARAATWIVAPPGACEPPAV